MYDLQFTAPQDAGSTVAIVYMFFLAGVYIDYSFALLSPTTGQTQSDLYTASLANANAYATLKGYTIGNITGWYPDPATPSKVGTMSATDKTKLNGLANVATSGDYNDLINKPSASAFKKYEALVSQTGTSAPTASNVAVNGFAGITMTWARTGTGTYTLTASAATFTANKTAVLISPASSPINNITYAVTSTTVITFTSSQLNLLALGVGNVDALLSNTLIEVRVYT